MRFLLFITHSFEPSGGWGDFQMGSDMLDDLHKYVQDNRSHLIGDSYHIVDLKHMEIIEEKDINE